MKMKLTTSAFDHGTSIPVQYTCKGENISPPFKITNPPDHTKSLVLIADDPDAPHGWIHWVLYNIPVDTSHIPEDYPKTYQQEDGACQGMTDFREVGYGGPCPPSGIHRYYFRLYALDIELNAHRNMTKEGLMSQISGHILETAEYMGIFGDQ